MVSSALTPIQKKILEYIEVESAHEGAPPTLRSIAKAFGFKAIGTVQGHVRALITKGFLEKNPGEARGVRLARAHRSQTMSVPLLGTVPAGIPREASEILMGATPVPAALAKKGNLFALRVNGESMRDAGIHDGDLVIARQQNTARNGDIVVALVDGSVTVKRFRLQGNVAKLLPENPAFAPIEIQNPQDAIQGKVVAVQRYYE